MKKLNVLYLISMISIIHYDTIKTQNNIITVFIQHANTTDPQETDHRPVEKISAKLQQPSFIFGVTGTSLDRHKNGVQGVEAMYLGYSAVSDKNGQIRFPRKQQSDQIYLLVTSEFVPAFMIAPTLVHHWTLDKPEQAAMYEINRLKNKTNNMYTFDVKKITPQADIPLNTIILFAEPDQISIKIGESKNYKSANFILPTLTAQPIDTVKNSIYTLSEKQYYEPVAIGYQYKASSIATIIANQ